MSYDVSGKLYEVSEINQISDTFKKREFIIEVENPNLQFQRTDYLKFQLTQDRCELIDAYSTGEMMKYVKATDAPYFLMLTECGLVSRLAVEDPEKNFIGGCRLCPYMKMNTLTKIRDALKAPKPEQVITLDADLSQRAGRCIERMIELAA